MPRLTLSGPSNSGVPSGCVLLVGTGFPANAPLKITASAAGITEIYSVVADNEGKINYVVFPTATVLQEAARFLIGAQWLDEGAKWATAAEVGNGLSGGVTVEIDR